jgi:hypothetical protein
MFISIWHFRESSRFLKPISKLYNEPIRFPSLCFTLAFIIFELKQNITRVLLIVVQICVFNLTYFCSFSLSSAFLLFFLFKQKKKKKPKVQNQKLIAKFISSYSLFLLNWHKISIKGFTDYLLNRSLQPYFYFINYFQILLIFPFIQQKRKKK